MQWILNVNRQMNLLYIIMPRRDVNCAQEDDTPQLMQALGIVLARLSFCNNYI